MCSASLWTSDIVSRVLAEDYGLHLGCYRTFLHVYTCVTYIHIFKYSYMHTYTIYIYIYIFSYVFRFILVYYIMHSIVQHVYTNMCVYIYIYIYLCLCVCVCVCVCVGGGWPRYEVSLICRAL